ncbi:MAG: hypothetical protein ACMUIG_10420 [Thermoplasmatota archaeon]
MARNKEGYKTYGPGDPIHIVVTQDFVGTANEFFSYCRDKGYNPSQIIRQAITEWLNKEALSETASADRTADNPLDAKLMSMVAQKRRNRSGRVSLRTAREILEGE